MGAEKGLAHLGLIRAIQEHEIEIDCVIGTSMGSLVGALYASNPEADTTERYRELSLAYVERTQSEATERGAIGFLLGVLVAAVSGGTAGPALAAGAGAGALGAATTRQRDIERFEEVMNEYFDERRIEELPIAYRTIHQRIGEAGISKIPIRGGNLAKEVSWSIANPLLFPNLELRSGARIDPGADSVAAIPLEYACAEFPDHQFIVSNVTDGELFTSKDMNCPFFEVTIAPVQVDRKKAILGQDPDFSQLVEAGYRAAQILPWQRLPHRSGDEEARALRGN